MSKHLGFREFPKAESLLFMDFYPPLQKATDVIPWMNARRIFSVALAKEDMLRRVAPDEACGGRHGRMPVGLHPLPEINHIC